VSEAPETRIEERVKGEEQKKEMNDDGQRPCALGGKGLYQSR